MRWGKIILIFQAVITLIIGIIFFIQVFTIEYHYEADVIDKSTKYNVGDKIVAEQLAKYKTFKDRFFGASYVLVSISIIELIIIWRLFDEPHISPEFEFKGQFSYS